MSINASTTGYVRNVRDQLAALEREGLLRRISEPVNKDTELHPLVRLQFRGVDAASRTGFLFENVTDARGRTFDVPVAVGVMAASPEVYAVGMGVDAPEKVIDRWQHAVREPLPPERTRDAPAQETIWRGDELQGRDRGLDALPIPISTPGLDIAPYITAGHWHTRDPETGIRNVGNYRGMLKASNRTGVFVAGPQHIGIHWEKCRRAGIPLEAAVVIGVPPVVSFCAVSKLPYGVDELAIAGGMAGEPLPVVRCVSVDIEVPAEAEFVIEGRIRTDVREPEGPFGEYHGYMAEEAMRPIFEVTAITMRKQPTWVSFLSQYPPSESSQIRAIPNERLFLSFLRDAANNPAVVDVAFPQYAGAAEMAVIALDPTHPSQTWKALNAAVALEAAYGKTIVAVDADVDPHDAEAIWWAINYHCQPHRDIRITRGKAGICSFSVGPDVEESSAEASYPEHVGQSALLIDATRKWPYPPISLPPRPIMEGARELWQRLDLPDLALSTPWHSSPTSRWSDELVQAASAATSGDYFETGKRCASRRAATDGLHG